MATDPNTAATDANAADWAAVDSRTETASELQGPADQVSPAAFTNFQPTPGAMAPPPLTVTAVLARTPFTTKPPAPDVPPELMVVVPL